jgi:hypothetical protein
MSCFGSFYLSGSGLSGGCLSGDGLSGGSFSGCRSGSGCGGLGLNLFLEFDQECVLSDRIHSFWFFVDALTCRNND